MFYMAEAMEQAISDDEFNGEGIKNAMYKKKNGFLRDLRMFVFHQHGNKMIIEV